MFKPLSDFYAQLNSSKTLQHRLVLFVIILLGFFLRFYAYALGQGYHFFTHGDELSAFEFGMRFLSGDATTLYLGQPTFGKGQLPGPVWTLVWVGLYQLGGQLLDGANFWMTCLTSLASLVTYWLARQFFSPRQSLLAAALIAIAPWAIYYAVGTWNPYPLVVMGGLLLLASWHFMQHPASKAVFWALLLAAMIPQFHMIGIFYAPALLLLLFINRSNLNRLWTSLGLLAGVLVYLPYLIGDGASDWQNLRNMLSSEEAFSISVAKTITGPVTMLSNMPGNWAGMGMEPLKAFGNWLMWDYRVLVAVSLLSALLALFFVASHVRSSLVLLKQHRFSLVNAYQQNPAVAFTGIYLYLPLLLFLFTGHNYATRYAIMILPLLFLLPIFALNKNAKTRMHKWLMILLGFVSFCNLYIVLGFYPYQYKQIETGDEFMPSHRKLAVIQDVLRGNAGANKWIAITLDNSLKRLNEDEHRAMRAVPYYMQTYQQYIEKLDRTNMTVSYRVQFRNDVDCAQHTCVYSSNNMVITRE